MAGGSNWGARERELRGEQGQASQALQAQKAAHPLRQDIGHLDISKRAEGSAAVLPPRNQEAAPLMPQLGKLQAKAKFGVRTVRGGVGAQAKGAELAPPAAHK
jgi:hypothetical protein